MKIFFNKKTAVIAVLFAVMLLSSKVALADTAAVGTSSNWAGYIAENGSTYTGVSGTWIVPQISYSTSLVSNATWIGIGGRTTNDLIQAGVYEIANSDGASYQAWYELLPDDSEPINLPVHPGDSISVAIIETSAGVWNIVITNNTSNQQYEKTVTYDSSLSSAEWIQERPLVDGDMSNLSGFTPIQFTGATVVENGQRLSLAQSGAQAVNMLDMPTNTALAVPSPIATDGMSFSIDRTSATVSPETTVTPQDDSYISPDQLLRTGYGVIPVIPNIPGITWLVTFPHTK